jgi:hypothetical protein
MIKQLTKTEYNDTMNEGMLDVTENAHPSIDIWDYVSDLVKEGIVIEYVLKNHLVEKVYRNLTNSFDHILLPTDRENTFIVIIADLPDKLIYGHYLLDLTKEYGLGL